MQERQLDPPEGTIKIPPPYELAYKLRTGNPKLYAELFADGLMDNLDKVLESYNSGSHTVVDVLDSIQWDVGDSELAIDWWRDIQ